MLMPSLILVYYYLVGKIIVLCFLKKQYAQKYSDFIILKQQHLQMTVNYNITNTILNLIRISK